MIFKINQNSCKIKIKKMSIIINKNIKYYRKKIKNQKMII